MVAKADTLAFQWDSILLKRLIFEKINLVASLNSYCEFGAKVGDSICFKTIYNSVYYGTIEKIDSDGYFFE